MLVNESKGRPASQGTGDDCPRPISTVFGLDRGLPIDRHYIEAFLSRHARCVHGRVLEFGDATYTRRFGGDGVTRSDVIHFAPGSAATTIIGDITCEGTLPHSTFDCILCTQTLHCIYEVQRAVANLHRALLPGGILLATLPGISQISRYDMDRWGDYWRFTSLSARRIFEEFFEPDKIQIEAHGNVAAATAFLQGNAFEELKKSDVEYEDPNYELMITLAAVREGDAR